MCYKTNENLKMENRWPLLQCLFLILWIFFLLHRAPRFRSSSSFCSYPYFHFKEFSNNHRPSQPLPLTTHPNTKTTSASCPASSSLLTDRGGMPHEHLWLTAPSPASASRLPPSLPASKAQHSGRSPGLRAEVETGNSGKQNEQILTVS